MLFQISSDEPVEVEAGRYHASLEDEQGAILTEAEVGEKKDDEETEVVAVKEETVLINRVRDIQVIIGIPRYKEIYMKNFSHVKDALENWKKTELQKLLIVLENEARKVSSEN